MVSVTHAMWAVYGVMNLLQHVPSANRGIIFQMGLVFLVPLSVQHVTALLPVIVKVAMYQKNIIT
jgi:hypothetical protein